MKIGILGGSFNPPHTGHLILAQEAYEALNLDKVVFVPTNISPHKENNNEADASSRLAMIKLAVADNNIFEVLDIELKRGGVSYTIDTVKQLRQIYGNDELFLIIGSDLANSFSTWKDFGELAKLTRIVVARRKEHPLDSKDDFFVIDVTHIEISSSYIRQKIKKGESIQYFVPKAVAEYIEQHNLYRRGR